jgi:hypothetical protein
LPTLLTLPLQLDISMEDKDEMIIMNTSDNLDIPDQHFDFTVWGALSALTLVAAWSLLVTVTETKVSGLVLTGFLGHLPNHPNNEAAQAGTSQADPIRGSELIQKEFILNDILELSGQ